MKKTLMIWLTAGLLLACQNEGINVREDGGGDDSILGTWLYTERGYSPGAGYVTVDVPADPPQTITFRSDLTMTSNIENISKYKHYRLIEDTVAQVQVLAFFEDYPGIKPPALEELTHAYSVQWEDDNLKLRYRWCIEGCHMKFRRLNSTDGE